MSLEKSQSPDYDVGTLYAPMIIEPGKRISIRSATSYHVQDGNETQVRVIVPNGKTVTHFAPFNARLYLDPLTYPNLDRNWNKLPEELKLRVLELNLSFNKISRPHKKFGQFHYASTWGIVNQGKSTIPPFRNLRIWEASRWPEVLLFHLALPQDIARNVKEVFFKQNTFTYIPRHNIADQVRRFDVSMPIYTVDWDRLSSISLRCKFLKHFKLVLKWNEWTSFNIRVWRKDIELPGIGAQPIVFSKDTKVEVVFLGKEFFDRPFVWRSHYITSFTVEDATASEQIILGKFRSQ
ncbi:hypothetical protein SLS60_006417 [Paraconiothyrium brasiliense]|uniref:Uncharacterized protein n=1 Tax=Paraconiothyrium brasiliense TaxID=300254 RepID=A0ABR3RAX9_9PLEO